MFKYLKNIFFLMFLMFSNQAFSQNYNISFNFPIVEGTGVISFDYPTPCTHCDFSQMSNFIANFNLSGNTWNQTNIITPISPTLYLEFNSATSQWYFDDTNSAILNGDIVITFDNGASQLAFAKGLNGVAQLNGSPITGNFIAFNTPTVAVPVLSKMGLLSLALLLILVGLIFSRKFDLKSKEELQS